MSVDTSAVRDEVEEMQERERIAWRVSCRRERERAKEREVQSVEVSSNYTEVVATVGRGAVGDGRQSALGWRGGEEVCSLNGLLSFKLVFNCSLIVQLTMVPWSACLISWIEGKPRIVGVVRERFMPCLTMGFPLVQGKRRRREGPTRLYAADF